MTKGENCLFLTSWTWFCFRSALPQLLSSWPHPRDFSLSLLDDIRGLQKHALFNCNCFGHVYCHLAKREAGNNIIMIIELVKVKSALLGDVRVQHSVKEFLSQVICLRGVVLIGFRPYISLPTCRVVNDVSFKKLKIKIRQEIPEIYAIKNQQWFYDFYNF